MTIEHKRMYVMCFWKYARSEQINDMTVLPIDVMGEYMIELGKEYYIQNKKKKLNIDYKLLNSKVVNLNKLHI